MRFKSGNSKSNDNVVCQVSKIYTIHSNDKDIKSNSKRQKDLITLNEGKAEQIFFSIDILNNLVVNSISEKGDIVLKNTEKCNFGNKIST